MQRIREGNIPDELHAHRDAPTVVSTVHRAKGLEFDQVIIVTDGWSPPYDEEDARTLFVAVSRTLSGLRTVGLPNVNGRLSLDEDAGRWTQRGWKRWKRLGIELKPVDVDVIQPPGKLLGIDPVETQQRLSHDVKPGDEVHLELIRPRNGAVAALYRVVWNDHTIGAMTEGFAWDVERVVKTFKYWQYPLCIDHLTVDAITTVVGDSMITEQDGLGPSGAYLVPSIVGMGRFIW